MIDKMSSSSLVSIIVPCRNERDHIESCVQSILSQRLGSAEFEVIVADGMSNDGTRGILKRLAEEHPRLRIIDNPRQRISTGLNAAIAKARGHVIIRMDAHTEYSHDYILQCLNVLRETEADNVGGPAHTKSSCYVQSVICAAFHSTFGVGGARFHDENYEGYVDTVTYGCWRREIFDQIGLFDETLFCNEDDEFNLRLRRNGGKIWQSPRIRSWYYPRGTLRSLLRQYEQYGYWKVPVILKHRVPASCRHLVPGSFVVLLIVLPMFSLVWLSALWVWLGLLGLYAACNLTASLVTAAHKGWRVLPLLPIVFGCYHFGYGLGFLRGFVDFIVLRRSPAVRYTQLTRITKV